MQGASAAVLEMLWLEEVTLLAAPAGVTILMEAVEMVEAMICLASINLYNCL